jgi:AcrR family transcriptional regulator
MTQKKMTTVGRPRGRTAQGEETRTHLYQIALQLIAERGFEATTLREVADRAGVSVGLLYKYFANKRAIVVTLYDELSLDFVSRAAQMPPGDWRLRFLWALRESLNTLRPHRTALYALIPVLIGGDENLFSSVGAVSRERVCSVFLLAVRAADDTPPATEQDALGRVLYAAHLGVVLWWLLDKSPSQSATEKLLQSIEGAAPLAELLIGLPFFSSAITEADALFQSALF